MEANEIIEEIEMWLEDSIDIEEAPGDGFYVEKFEHAAVIRWGSKKGSFPRVGRKRFKDIIDIIFSGKTINETDMVIPDDGAVTSINVEKIAYKYLIETLMEGHDIGYEVQTNPIYGPVFKIRVEKIRDGD